MTDTAATDPVEDNSPPSQILVCLGDGIFFEHAGTADVMSVKVRNPDELETVIDEAVRRLAKCLEEVKKTGEGSEGDGEFLETIHVILKSSSVSSVYDSKAVSSFVPYLKTGVGTVEVHVLGSEDSPVQPADVDEIRFGLVMDAGLMLEQEGNTGDDNGGWVLVVRKPGVASEDDEEEEEVEEEEEAKADGEKEEER